MAKDENKKKSKGIVKKILIGLSTVTAIAGAYLGISQVVKNNIPAEPPIVETNPNQQQQQTPPVLTYEEKEVKSMENTKTYLNQKIFKDMAIIESAEVKHLDVKQNVLHIRADIVLESKVYPLFITYHLSDTPVDFQGLELLLPELESQKIEFVSLSRLERPNEVAVDFYNSSNIGGKLLELKNDENFELIDYFAQALDSSEYGHTNFECRYMFKNKVTKQIVYVDSVAVMKTPTHSQLMLFEQEHGVYSYLEYQYYQVKHGNYTYREDNVYEYSIFGMYAESIIEQSQDSDLDY